MAAHWPRFNGKLPEDMTYEEITEYIDKDDMKSLKNIILYSRGYLPIYEISRDLVLKNNLEHIKYLIDSLIEMFVESIERILVHAINYNSLDIIKYITENHMKYVNKDNIKYNINSTKNTQIQQYLKSKYI